MKYICLSLVLVASSFSYAEDKCESVFCAASQDYKSLYDEAKTAAGKQAAAIKTSMDAASDEAFKPKTSLAGSSCLDGIYGLSADAKLIDPRNFAMLKYSQILKDYIKKTACTAAVTAANKQIVAVNKKINEAGQLISQQTYGLISFSSETNQDGEFKVTKKITAIQDSKLMKNISVDVNKTVNKKYFNQEDPFNGKNYVDITDKQYMKKGASKSTEQSKSITTDQLEEGALCYFNKC